MAAGSVNEERDEEEEEEVVEVVKVEEVKVKVDVEVRKNNIHVPRVKHWKHVSIQTCPQTGLASWNIYEYI